MQSWEVLRQFLMQMYACMVTTYDAKPALRSKASCSWSWILLSFCWCLLLFKFKESICWSNSSSCSQRRPRVTTLLALEALIFFFIASCRCRMLCNIPIVLVYCKQVSIVLYLHLQSTCVKQQMHAQSHVGGRRDDNISTMHSSVQVAPYYWWSDE